MFVYKITYLQKTEKEEKGVIKTASVDKSNIHVGKYFKVFEHMSYYAN